MILPPQAGHARPRMVFYAVESLVERGLLEERGNDFYALTPEGRRAAGRGA